MRVFGFVLWSLTDASASAAAPQIDELDVLVEGGARKGLEPPQKVVRLLRKVDIVAAVNLHFEISFAARLICLLQGFGGSVFHMNVDRASRFEQSFLQICNDPNPESRSASRALQTPPNFPISSTLRSTAIHRKGLWPWNLRRQIFLRCMMLLSRYSSTSRQSTTQARPLKATAIVCQRERAVRMVIRVGTQPIKALVGPWLVTESGRATPAPEPCNHTFMSPTIYCQ